MRAFELAFSLWIGTILLSCGFVALGPVFTLSGNGFLFVIIGGVIATVIACPLLIPTTLLIRYAGKIPYNETVKLLAFGFTLLLVNFLFFEAIAWMAAWDGLKGIFYYWITIVAEGKVIAFLMSSVALVLMLFFKRNKLKQFFSLQTENTQS